LYILPFFLKRNLKEELELIETNWQSYAISEFGLKLSYVANSIASILILFDTVQVFFHSPGLIDILLNYVALQFLVNFDEEIAEMFHMTKGKHSEKEQGAELLLDVVQNGRRGKESFEIWKNGCFVKYFMWFFWIIVIGLGVWELKCLK